MTWIKLDTNCPMSPRICAAGDRAAWLWVQALCWSAANFTDGHVPAGMLLRISGEMDAHDLAARLVDAGLFEPDGDGWTIHKFTDYQRTREEVEAQRASWRKQKSRSRYVLAAELSALESGADSAMDSAVVSGADSAVVSAVDSAVVSGADMAADITRTPRNVREGRGRGVRPLEKRREESDTRERPAATVPSSPPFLADFNDWWSGWPKKVDRKAAYQRYAARRRDGVAPDILLAAWDRYVAGLSDRQYCKHGATFLNASDGPWSEFTSGPAPDTGDDQPDVLPPFLALSRVEDKLRARGVPVDVERLDAVVRTLGFTGAWYDLPATLDILEAALADTPVGDLTGTELVTAVDAPVAATTVLTAAGDVPTVDDDAEEFAW